MPSFRTDGGLDLSVERRAPQLSEDELREARTAKFVKLLDGVSKLAPESFDTPGVRAAFQMTEDQLDRDAARRFTEGFQRLLAREASR